MGIPKEKQEKVRLLKERLAAASGPEEQLELRAQLAEELWLVAPDEARPILERLLTDAPALGAHGAHARSANMLAEISRRVGAPDASARYAEIALAAARRAGSRQAEVGATNLIGTLHMTRGDYARARDCFERCRELSREAQFPAGEQVSLNQLGNLYGLQGLPQRALECYRQCLEVDERSGDSYGRVSDYYNIGWALEQTGRWEEAAENLYRTIALAEQHGFRDLRLDATNVLGELFLKRDKTEEALSMFNVVIEAERREPMHALLFRNALGNLGLAHFRADNLAAAEKAYAEAVALSEDAGDRREQVILCWRRAELALARGQLELAEELLRRASGLADELGLRGEKGEVMRVWALLHAEQSDARRTCDCFEQALDFLKEMPGGYEAAQVRLQYGRFLVEAGDRERAVPLLQEAARAFRRLSVVYEAEEANKLLFRLEMHTDREAAMLAGLSGLLAIGLEPVSLFERALAVIAETYGFDAGAVLRDGRPLVMLGKPTLEAAARECAGDRVTSSARTVCAPVRVDGGGPGIIYLERRAAGPELPVHLIRRVADVLTAPMQRLVGLPLRPHADFEVPGLHYRGIIGRSPVMRNSLEVAARVAGATIPVLIRGESGTGKELMARALHESSTRRDAPFVAINCAAVPETLLEAEFFGIEKGAATGVVARKGKFELANGGTVFLDEVGDMSPSLQAKLLRVLQDKQLERVGGSKLIQADIRVVAATNQDLEELMRKGEFRKDLFYRLNAVELTLPPLRERKEDIPDFVRYFITRSNQEYKREVLGASPEVMTRLLLADWAGNIRQLQHVIERAVILARGQVLEIPDLPQELRDTGAADAADSGVGLRDARREVERRAAADVEKAVLTECLEQADWNVSRAAELAKYSRAQFYRLMKKHSIRRTPKRPS